MRIYSHGLNTVESVDAQSKIKLRLTTRCTQDSPPQESPQDNRIQSDSIRLNPIMPLTISLASVAEVEWLTIELLAREKKRQRDPMEDRPSKRRRRTVADSPDSCDFDETNLFFM